MNDRPSFCRMNISRCTLQQAGGVAESKLSRKQLGTYVTFAELYCFACTFTQNALKNTFVNTLERRRDAFVVLTKTEFLAAILFL